MEADFKMSYRKSNRNVNYTSFKCSICPGCYKETLKRYAVCLKYFTVSKPHLVS